LSHVLRAADHREIYVIARWLSSDIARSASDIEVYPLLKDNGIPFYINMHLHSKIYVFRSGAALCGSGNATARGLGVSNDSNIETCAWIERLDLHDEVNMKTLRDSSIRVTDEVYLDFKRRAKETEAYLLDSGDDDDIYEKYLSRTAFLIADLPATRHPDQLLKYLVDSTPFERMPREKRQRVVSDCCNFGLSEQLSKAEAAACLRRAFCASPFIVAVVEEIRRRGSMRFGAVVDFVESHCRDVPMPFRTEIKERVRTLYDWLVYFYEDLTWHVPGAKSQVIRVVRHRG